MSDNHDDGPHLTFLHCQQCLDELKLRPRNKKSPAAYARLEVAITGDGNVLVWCHRHDMEVANLTPQVIKEIAAEQRCDHCGEQNGSDKPN